MNKPLKILLLTPDFNLLCGRSKSVLNLAISLKNNRYEVEIATNGGNNTDKITNNGLNVIFLKYFSDGIKPLTFLKSIIELKTILSDKSFDVIHSHHRFFELVINIINCLFYKKSIGTVFTAHNVYTKKRLLQFISNKIIAVSDFIKKDLVNNNNVDKNKIVVVYNYLLANEINELQNIPAQKAGDDLAILASGRFDLSKNFKVLLDSLKLLKSEKIQLNLVGEGIYEKDYEKLISNNSLNVRIFKPTKKFFEFINNSDVCIITSGNEGMSYFVLESICSNKYIIAPKVGGHLELLEGYNRYLLFNAFSPEELAECIKNIISNNVLAKFENSNLSNQKFMESYSVKAITNIYKEVLINRKSKI